MSSPVTKIFGGAPVVEDMYSEDPNLKVLANGNYIDAPASDFPRVLALTEYVDAFDCIIAGGVFKSLFLGQPINDIDLFFRDSKRAVMAVDRLDGAHTPPVITGKQLYTTGNAIGYKRDSDGQRFEIVTSRKGTPREILNTFDFTVSRFALYKEDGEYRVTHHVDYTEDIQNRRLVLPADADKDPIGTFERGLKYSRYGFRMSIPTKKKLIEDIINKYRVSGLVEGDFSNGDVGDYLRGVSDETPIDLSAPSTIEY
jgi:hypothetical protein